MKISKESIELIQNILTRLSSVYSKSNRNLERFELVDKYLQKTGDYSTTSQKAELINQLGLKDRIRNIEVPIAFIYKEAAHAFLTATFLTGHPIFAAVSRRDQEQAAAMLTNLSARDEQRFGWAGELLRELDDVLKYNICAHEVSWSAIRAASSTTLIEQGNSRTERASPIIYEGNQIKRIDPYNLLVDPHVEPCRVHIDGTYAGYVEVFDYIRMKLQYHEWNDLYTIKMNIPKIFGEKPSANYSDFYYKPSISKSSNQYDPNNWAHFWGVRNSSTEAVLNEGRFEVVTMYQRIIPREFKLGVPQSGVPQIYKLIWVNGHLAYVEPYAQGHEFLPIVVGQLYPGSPEIKSFVEYIVDLQDLSTSMIQGSLSSMRRAVGDRGIYNKSMIRKDDIETPNPTGKIPATTNRLNTDLRQAYMHIPYNDNISGNFLQHMGLIGQLAEDTTGINRATQGNFIRGNKTMYEFDTIMSKSDARLQLGAFQLENFFFRPTKEMLKINYLVYAMNEEIENRADGTTIQIDVEVLRRIAPDFKMADGIMPTTKLANTEVIVQAIQMISQSPDPMLQIQYDFGGMITSILKQEGFTDLDQYQRTPEQMQQVMQMMQQPQKEESDAEQ